MHYMRSYITAALLLVLAAVILMHPTGFRERDPELEPIPYDAVHYPNITCLGRRVIVESAPGLSAAARAELWHNYGLSLSFEWVVPESGFTYHELTVKPPTLLKRTACMLLGKAMLPRDLPELVASLNEDPRIHWAAPDALLLAWCDEPSLPPGEELVTDTSAPTRDTSSTSRTAYGVSFVDKYFRPLGGGLSAWESGPELPDPLPDFEYYRLCAPEGTAIDWALALTDSSAFMQRCQSVYGTNQALALSRYYAAGTPALDTITVCVADTGVHVNHPDLSNRQHPNSIDANYRNYQIAAPGDRPAPGDTINDRYSERAVGLPRQAIKERPASHGTETAGILARCTAGFGKDGDAIRILPASVKSARTVTLSGYQLKSPISAFVKLVACLNQDFPVGSYTPADGDRLQNAGDVRVVSTSASVPPSYFTEAEWRVVAPLVGKAAGSIAEDLRTNDRIYVFAAGNDAQPKPNRPCEMDYIIGVTATMAYDGTAPWSRNITGEGANLGQKCIAAPGYGLITSTIAPHPNLAYLPSEEFRKPRENFSTPPREQSWEWQRNTFGASSGATPQVAALAALLYAQDTFRNYSTVQALIYDSVSDRLLTAAWGESRGIIDYEYALEQGW